MSHARRPASTLAKTHVDLSVPPLAELRRRRSEKWALFEPDVLSLTIAEMDFPIAAEIRTAITEMIQRSNLGYAMPAPASLRAAFSAFMQRRLAWEVDPEQVTLVPDVMLGLTWLCQTLARRSDLIGFATPAYPPFFRELTTAGLRPATVSLHPDGSVDLDALDAALTQGMKVFVLANPHNPTGRVAPRAELETIAERCAAHGTWVLADEIHAPLVLPGATHVPWTEVSDAARSYGIALSSASKAFNLAALKTAFIVTASEPARAVVAQLGPQHDHASLLGEVAAEVAFRKGDAWLDAVIDQLDRNRAYLARALPQHLPGIDWRSPEATYLSWLDCRRLDLGDDPADAFLRRGRVALGRGLNYGAPGAGHVRLNFATSPEHLYEALKRMATATRA